MHDFLDGMEPRTWYVSYDVAGFSARQKVGPFTLNECVRQRDDIVGYEGVSNVLISSEETL